MLGSAAILAAFLVLGRWNTPESPRWLISKGRTAQALEIVRTVWGPSADLADLQEPVPQVTSYLKIFSAGYRRRTMFVGLFWMFQVIPLFAIYTFGPQILEAFKLGEGNLQVVGYALINIFFVVGCLPQLFLMNSLGRRPTIVWSFFFMTVALLVLGLFPDASPDVVLGCFLIYAFFSGGPSVLEWIYPNELFPTDVRATAVGAATAISREGAAIGTLLAPVPAPHLRHRADHAPERSAHASGIRRLRDVGPRDEGTLPARIQRAESRLRPQGRRSEALRRTANEDLIIFVSSCFAWLHFH